MKDFRAGGYAWLNGNFVKWKDAKIHAASHGFLYGTGVFEGINCYSTSKGPALFRLNDHVERLLNSARIMKMKVKWPQRQIEKACIDVVRKNKLRECYLRLILSYGYGKIGLSPLDLKTDCIIMAWQQKNYLGKRAMEEGIRLKTSSIKRVFGREDFSGAKITGNYYTSALAKAEAVEAGCDEALLLDQNGFVCECSVENIFMAKNHNLLVTPPTEKALGGITRKSVIEIARDEEIEVQERGFTPEELYSAKEVFVTGTSAGVTPVLSIDGKKIGNGKPGPLTLKMQKTFFEAARAQIPKYEKWLSFVEKK